MTKNDLFGLKAAEFDTDLRVQRAGRIAQEIRRHILPSHKTAMEFGCGTGLVGMELIDAFERIEFVDLSPGMIEQVQAKIIHHKNASARVCDLAAEGGDMRYDFIFSSMVIHHIRKAEEMLHTLSGMLAPGGKLVTVDFEQVDPRLHGDEAGFNGHHGFETDAFRAMMERAGLKEIEYEVAFKGINSSHGADISYTLFLCAGTNAPLF